MILDGRVTVNGVTAVLGQSADPETDMVCIDGVPLAAAGERTYIMLNKPRGYVTTLRDEKGRKTAAELVADAGSIPMQREASGRTTGTNTDQIFRSRMGVPATNLSMPLRYMHSPVETADMDDVQACVDLLVAFIKSLKVKDDFRHKL